MRSTFYIQANINTPAGPETFLRFELGDDREAALHIFGQLAGHADTTTGGVLTMELMETMDGLPLNVLLIGCTLDELGDNCRIITKEVFKLLNLPF